MLRLKHRNREMKLCPLTYFTFHPNAAAVSFDEMFGDGKAQARAANFAGPGDVDAVKPLKDARLVHFGDADSRVRNDEFDFLSVGRGGNGNPAAGWRVLYGVIQQVLQDFGQTPAV